MNTVVKVACPHCGDELTVPSTACRLVLAGQGNEFLSVDCPDCHRQVNKPVTPPQAGELLAVGVEAVNAPEFSPPTWSKPLTEDDLIEFGRALHNAAGLPS